MIPLVCYVIFPDKTLTEMALVCSQSEAAMLEISGVGETKLARYGEAFLIEIGSVGTQ